MSRKAARSRVTLGRRRHSGAAGNERDCLCGGASAARRSLDPGLQGASEADLVTVLNLKQTIDGQTVTLDYAYADSNRISFSITASGTTPLDIGYRFNDVELTDDAGHHFQTMFGGGGGGGGGGDDGSEMTTTSYSSNITNSVDASVITEMPDTLKLHLTAAIRPISACHTRE